MSAPWMPLYCADFMADTSHLNAAETGAYIMLIMHYWRVGCLPPDDRGRQRVSRMSIKEWTTHRARLAAFFDADWKHGRIEKERAKARLLHCGRSAVGSSGGKAKALKLKEVALANATILLEQISSKKVAISQPQSHLSKDKVIDANASIVLGQAEDGNGDPAKNKAENARETVDGFIRGWDSLAASTGLKPCRAVSDKRRSCILARAKDLTSAFDFPDANSGFADLFARIRGSPKLLGRDKLEWKCDLDWVITESHFLQIMEGKYAPQPKQFSFIER